MVKYHNLYNNRSSCREDTTQEMRAEKKLPSNHKIHHFDVVSSCLFRVSIAQNMNLNTLVFKMDCQLFLFHGFGPKFHNSAPHQKLVIYIQIQCEL